MANGGYRYTDLGQQYSYQGPNNGSHQFPSPHHRTASAAANPIVIHRENDGLAAPWPTRPESPATSMYGQNHHQAQHSMLNGAGPHQRYQMQMGIAKHFPGQGGQHQGGHHQSHTPDIGLNGYGNHQHNVSSGTLSSATPHFTPSHMQSATPVSGQSGSHRPDSEHWVQQQRVAAAIREVNQPHFFARNMSGPNKQALSSSLQGVFSRDDENDTKSATNGQRHLWKTLDFSVQGLRVLAPSLFRYPFIEKLYFNQNKLTWLTSQIGQLRNLTFLDLSQNQLESLPPEMGMLVNLKSLHLVDNHLETLPFEMGYLYQLETLGIDGNPLNDEMRGLIAEGGTQELVRYMRENADRPAPPNDRDWIVLDETPQANSNEDRFTVFDANILCPKYVTATQYPYVPSRALAWDHRRDVVMAEIKNRNADIICLQEIDSETFHEDFRPSLAVSDYKGLFWQKSRAQTMGEREAKLVDGCATFWKNSKYVLLDKQMVDFRKMAINRADMKGEHDVFNRVMTRDDIATVTFLENRATGSRIIVMNTHVFWNPEFADVKIVQAAILLEYVGKLAETYAKWPPCKDKEVFKYANGDSDAPEAAPVAHAPSQHYASATDIPMLLCGDFNSTPDSGPYELISTGSLANTHAELTGRSYGSFTRDGMQHPFNLKSSYSNIGELEFTNYTAAWQGIVDYIWYSANSLHNTALLGEIDRSYLQRVPGFPSWHFASDHLPLMAEFVVKGKKERKVVEADFGPSSRDRRP